MDSWHRNTARWRVWLVALWLFAAGLFSWVVWAVYKLVTQNPIGSGELVSLVALFFLFSGLGVVGGIVGDLATPISVLLSQRGIRLRFRFAREREIRWSDISLLRLVDRKPPRRGAPRVALLEFEIPTSRRGVHRLELPQSLASAALEIWHRGHERTGT